MSHDARAPYTYAYTYTMVATAGIIPRWSCPQKVWGLSLAGTAAKVSNKALELNCAVVRRESEIVREE